MNIQATLKEALSSEASLRFAMLFGSRAIGNESKESDIDIGIHTVKPLSPAQHIALTEKISQACGLPVDLVDIQKAGEPLLGEILKGVVLIGTTDQKAALLSRHLLDQADFGPIRKRILDERREKWINK